MKINVRFFAALREAVGCDSFEVTLDAAVKRTEIVDLLAVLRTRVGAAGFEALRAPNVRIAVNQAFVESDCGLRDGDEVAFMPPITGG